MAISGIGGSSTLNRTTNVQDRAQKLIEQMDSDGDGKVSKQEFTAMGEKMKANGPRSGELGAAAASKGTKGANAPAPPSADELFAKADKDGDGSLSVTDLSAMMAEQETHAAARGAPSRGGGAPPPGGPPPGGAAPGGAGGPGGSGASGSSKSSSSSSSKDSDPADTNGDGTVSAAEKLIYQLSHPNVSDTNAS